MATHYPKQSIVAAGLLALTAGLLSCHGWNAPEFEAIAAAAPDSEDVTVEHGDPARPGITLCESSSTFIAFDRMIERQVFDVLTSYKTGLPDTLERLTAKTIVSEAERYNVDVWLVVGLIRVESRFNNFAESNKGARGLMQVMPATAAELAADLDLPWTGADSLYNPIKNVKLGVAYLAILQRRFGGDLDKVLAAYNMGPGRVREWMRDGRDLPTGYASLCQEYRTRLGRIGKGSISGADLRSPITAVERMMAKKHHITIVPVADLDSAQDGVAAAASLPGLLSGAALTEPAIEAMDDSPSTSSPFAIELTTDGGLLDALIADEKSAPAQVEPAFSPLVE